MTIQEIKSRLSILLVLNHYLLLTDQNGMMRCPFHDDETPSMKVYLRTNTVCCFAGSCKIKSLDVIDFIMHMDKCSKHQAILKAKAILLDEPIERKRFNHQSDKNITMINTPNQNPDIQLLTEVFTYFEKGLNLPQTKGAQNYKASRGLNGKVPIGYNAGRFDQNKSEEIVERLLSVGLLKPNTTGLSTLGQSLFDLPLEK